MKDLLKHFCFKNVGSRYINGTETTSYPQGGEGHEQPQGPEARNGLAGPSI
ncbi:hypothetical protein GCM10010917_30150 [Paenibacillus physcomitrellae]|uniref:Uncharacterized protein n=1 Tax=Paenibacillus physcomitrellae TaxID=1619311 RepID=A0ABQ1GFE5_9BACL|nr:hypothetical protein GCM10010917_30150 [Paenibacillus physcomitrellae]